MTSSIQDNSSSKAVAVTAAWTDLTAYNSVSVCTYDPGAEFCASPAMDALRCANRGLDVPSFYDKRRP